MDSATLVAQLQRLVIWPHDAAFQQSVTELSKTTSDAKALARELMQRNLLTPYQANQLLAGKGRELNFGAYLLMERLGEGATGEVFKVDLGAKRILALKRMRPERLPNQTAVERFLREVRAAVAMNHPNVISVCDVGHSAEGLYYFAMPYIPGGSLSQRVKRAGPLGIAQACEIIRQTALGLAHIHERGFVHRDIKPSNLAIAESAGPDAMAGQVKILDLGLIRLCEVGGEGQPTQLTQLGMPMGTTDYMAPEQGRDSRSADARSDLYSLGCTLYFALSGKPPFPGGTPMEKLLHHQLDEPERLENLRPEVPPVLAGIVHRLMAKDPAQRYQTAQEVAAAVRPFCLEVPVTLVPVVAVGRQPAPVPVGMPEANPVAAPEFNLLDTGDEPMVLWSSLTASPLRRQSRGEWFWGGIVAVMFAISFLIVLVLRFIFL